MMNRSILEWVWRVALLCALGLIAWELHALHEDLNLPVEDQATVASSKDESLDSVDAIRDDIEALAQKVNAILVVMARSKQVDRNP